MPSSKNTEAESPKVTVTLYVNRLLTEDELSRVHEAAVEALPVDAVPSVSSAVVSGEEGS